MGNNLKEDEMMAWLDLVKGNLSSGITVELPVLSGSMAPVLLPGAKITIVSKSYKLIKTGDIVVFRKGNSLTAHRLLFKLKFVKGTLLFQKGDANRFGNWINSEQVAGIVCALENTNGEKIDLLEKAERTKARLLAGRQLLYCIGNIFLIFPRGIYRWLKSA